jgi:hypothetical protein
MNSNNPASGGSSAANADGSAQSGATIVGTKKGLQAHLQQLLQGVEAVIPDGSSLPVGSGNESKADMVAELTQVLSVYMNAEARQIAAINARTQVKDARVADHALYTKLKDARVADHALYTKLKDAVIAYFGKGNPLLTQFGIKPRGKARVLTPEQKMLRTAKLRATRAARHTMGSRQKAAVKSDGKLLLSVQTESASGQSEPAVNAGTPKA